MLNLNLYFQEKNVLKEIFAEVEAKIYQKDHIFTIYNQRSFQDSTSIFYKPYQTTLYDYKEKKHRILNSEGDKLMDIHNFLNLKFNNLPDELLNMVFEFLTLENFQVKDVCQKWRNIYMKKESNFWRFHYERLTGCKNEKESKNLIVKSGLLFADVVYKYLEEKNTNIFITLPILWTGDSNLMKNCLYFSDYYSFFSLQFPFFNNVKLYEKMKDIALNKCLRNSLERNNIINGLTKYQKWLSRILPILNQFQKSSISLELQERFERINFLISNSYFIPTDDYLFMLHFMILFNKPPKNHQIEFEKWIDQENQGYDKIEEIYFQKFRLKEKFNLDLETVFKNFTNTENSMDGRFSIKFYYTCFQEFLENSNYENLVHDLDQFYNDLSSDKFPLLVEEYTSSLRCIYFYHMLHPQEFLSISYKYKKL